MKEYKKNIEKIKKYYNNKIKMKIILLHLNNHKNVLKILS